MRQDTYERIHPRYKNIKKKALDVLNNKDVEFGFKVWDKVSGKKTPLYFNAFDMTEVDNNKCSIILTSDSFRETWDIS